jgi:hypothetical protein
MSHLKAFRNQPNTKRLANSNSEPHPKRPANSFNNPIWESANLKGASRTLFVKIRSASIIYLLFVLPACKDCPYREGLGEVTSLLLNQDTVTPQKFPRFTEMRFRRIKTTSLSCSTVSKLAYLQSGDEFDLG